MITKIMTEQDAKEICSWKYLNEYSVYNMGSWDDVVKQNWAITNEIKRQEQFRSVYEKDELIGYFRFRLIDDVINIGLGMKPELCGHGKGKEFLAFILNTKELKDKKIELEVREFNQRAIKSYEQVGFKIIKKEERETLNGKDNFIIMKNY